MMVSGRDHQRHILVVDDEAPIRDLVKALLGRAGHWVESAECGSEALDKIELADFDLVFTDFEMPEMTGERLAREIKKRKPDLPVALLSGRVSVNPAPSDIALLLPKPFSVDALREAVSALT